MLPVISILSALFFWSGCKESSSEFPASLPQPKTAGGLNSKNRLGERHLRSQRYQPALEAFREALEGAEDSVRAYVGLSHVHLELGDLARAEETLGLASALDTTRSEVFYARALFLLRKYSVTHRGPLLDQGLAAARQAISLAPDQQAYFYILGSLYSYRGDRHSTHEGDLDSGRDGLSPGPEAGSQAGRGLWSPGQHLQVSGTLCRSGKCLPETT